MLLVVVLGAAGCGGKADRVRVQAPVASCPTPSAWQSLANRVGDVVFCPTWMPPPIDARIGGDYANGVDVRADRSYLVSFLWHEPGGSDEVHLNFRGYPGRTAIPRCLRPTGAKRVTAPCFSDSHG